MSNSRRKFLIGAVALAATRKAAAEEKSSPRKYDEHVRDLLSAGLKDAFQNQVAHIFITWMKDDARQPERARNGVQTAMANFQLARFELGVELATVQEFGNMLREALDTGFTNYMEGVFRTVMYESGKRKGEVRILRDKAVNAYLHAHKAVDSFVST